MKSEFEKWYRDKYQITKPLYFFEDTQRYEDGFTQDAWEVWQHQQSKVDKLTKQRDSFIKAYEIEVDKSVELQKRVNAALKMISINRGFAWGSVSISQLEQTLKGGATPSLSTDENGECRHFSTAMFNEGKAECFHCDAIVNEKREVIGKQSKGLHPFFKEDQKN